MGAISRSWKVFLGALALQAIPLWTASAQTAEQDAQAAPPPAHLAPPPTKPLSTEPIIIVTGSRIPRTNLTAVSPVTMVTQNEVKLEGTTNIEELLNQLPQVAPAQGVFTSNGATGAATVDLRGLGEVRTLVLINGRRLMPGDPRDPVADINVVPASMIERVEILTGGAAAVYGSDAVAGVVNFILDTKLEGLRLDGQTSFFQHDNRDGLAHNLLDQAGISYPRGSTVDGGRKNADAAFGKSFLDGRGHLTIYGGYRQIKELRQDSRDYSACSIATAQGDPNHLACGGSFVSYPGNFFDNFGNVFQVTPDRTFVPGFDPYNFGPWNFYQRPDRRYTAGGFANLEISAAAQPYAEVMYMNDRSVAQIAPSGDFANVITINCDNPLMSAQQRSLICKEGNFVGEIPLFDDNGNFIGVDGSPQPFKDPVTGKTYYEGFLAIGRRNVEGGPRQDDLQHESVRVLGGFKGDLGRGVSYDASYLYGRVTLTRQYRDDISITRLSKALDVITNPETGQPVCRSVLTGEDPTCVPWDVFAVGAVTQAASDYLGIVSNMNGSFKEAVWNANFTAELGQWGIRSPWSAESPAINFGGELRKDTVDYEPDQAAQSGDIAGFGFTEFPIHGSVGVKEAFAEARIPLITDGIVQAFAFEGGYRKSRYHNGTSTFSTSASKLALDLTPMRGLRFRASQQRAVRAPNVQELFTPIQGDSFDRDPCVGDNPTATEDQCAATGVTPAEYGHILAVNQTLFGYNSIVGGNVDLQPETARTRSIGVVLEPRFLRGFAATVDWWDIQLQGAIQQIGAQTIMDTCIATRDPFFCNRIHRDPSGSLWLGSGHIDDRQANIGAEKVRGVDVGVTSTHRLGRFGSANVDFQGSYTLHWIVDNGGLSEPYDCAGLFGDPCGVTTRWKHTARVTWLTPVGASVSLHWRHTGAMKLAALDPKFGLLPFVSPLETKLPTADYFDVTAAFTIKKKYEFRLGVSNIFDRQPPLVLNNTPSSGNTTPNNGNTYPEWYDPLGRYIFAAFTMNLNP